MQHGETHERILRKSPRPCLLLAEHMQLRLLAVPRLASQHRQSVLLWSLLMACLCARWSACGQLC